MGTCLESKAARAAITSTNVSSASPVQRVEMDNKILHSGAEDCCECVVGAAVSGTTIIGLERWERAGF